MSLQGPPLAVAHTLLALAASRNMKEPGTSDCSTPQQLSCSHQQTSSLFSSRQDHSASPRTLGPLSWDGWRSFVGRLSCLREVQRLARHGAQGTEAAAHAGWEPGGDRTLPRRKRATRTKFSRTHTLAKTGNFRFCWRCGFYQGLAGRCRGIVQKTGVEYSGRSRMAGTKKTDDGGRSQAGRRWTGRTWSRRRRRKLDGTGAMWYMSWRAAWR